MKKKDVLRILGSAVQNPAYDSLKQTVQDADIKFILDTLPNPLFRSTWSHLSDVIRYGVETVDGVDYETRVQSLRDKLSDPGSLELRKDIMRVEEDDHGDRTFFVLMAHLLNLAELE